MSKTVQIVARLDPDLVRIVDQMPGASRTEKLARMIEQSGIVAALLDEQRAMLAQVQQVVSNLHRQPQQIAQQATPSAGGVSPADLAAIFQALALISRAVGKPAMAEDATSFCNAKFKEIFARNKGD